MPRLTCRGRHSCATHLYSGGQGMEESLQGSTSWIEQKSSRRERVNDFNIIYDEGFEKELRKFIILDLSPFYQEKKSRNNFSLQLMYYEDDML